MQIELYIQNFIFLITNIQRKSFTFIRKQIIKTSRDEN